MSWHSLTHTVGREIIAIRDDPIHSKVTIQTFNFTVDKDNVSNH